MKGKFGNFLKMKHTLEMNLVKVVTSHELNVHDSPNSGGIWSPFEKVRHRRAETKEKAYQRIVQLPPSSNTEVDEGSRGTGSAVTPKTKAKAAIVNAMDASIFLFNEIIEN
jgi:hypothetical protein